MFLVRSALCNQWALLCSTKSNNFKVRLSSLKWTVIKISPRIGSRCSSSLTWTQQDRVCLFTLRLPLFAPSSIRQIYIFISAQTKGIALHPAWCILKNECSTFSLICHHDVFSCCQILLAALFHIQWKDNGLFLPLPVHWALQGANLWHLTCTLYFIWLPISWKWCTSPC